MAVPHSAGKPLTGQDRKRDTTKQEDADRAGRERFFSFLPGLIEGGEGPGKELFVLAHLGAGAGAVVVILAIIRLIGYVIDDDKRWRKFLFLVFLLMAAAAAAGWWLLGDGGMEILLHDFGTPGITRSVGVVGSTVT